MNQSLERRLLALEELGQGESVQLLCPDEHEGRLTLNIGGVMQCQHDEETPDEYRGRVSELLKDQTRGPSVVVWLESLDVAL